MISVWIRSEKVDQLFSLVFPPLSSSFLFLGFIPPFLPYFRLPWWLQQERICLQCGRPGFDPWVGKIPWRRAWQPTPVFLPGESHGQRSLVGCSPWGCKESDTTQPLSTAQHSTPLFHLPFSPKSFPRQFLLYTFMVLNK